MSYYLLPGRKSFLPHCCWIKDNKLQHKNQILPTEVLFCLMQYLPARFRMSVDCQPLIMRFLHFTKSRQTFTWKKKKRSALIFHFHGGTISCIWAATASFRQACSLLFSSDSHCQPSAGVVWVPFTMALVQLFVLCWGCSLICDKSPLKHFWF